MKTTKLINGIAAVIIIGSLWSCRVETGDAISSISPVVTDSVKLAKDTMMVYDVQRIVTYAKYQKNCEGFYGYDYRKDNFTRKVTAYKFKTDGSCGELVTLRGQFDFKPEQSGNYLFKFWNGKDTSGNDLWIEKTVVVTP